MHSTIRVWLVAACYGLWAGLWAVASFAIISLSWSNLWHSDRSTLGELIELLPYAAFTMVASALGWAMVHLRSRQPGPGTYIALAIAIVVVVHLVLIYSDRAPPGTFLIGAFILLLLHFWLTMPIAVGATGLFVWCLRRWNVL